MCEEHKSEIVKQSDPPEFIGCRVTFADREIFAGVPSNERFYAKPSTVYIAFRRPAMKVELDAFKAKQPLMGCVSHTIADGEHLVEIVLTSEASVALQKVLARVNSPVIRFRRFRQKLHRFISLAMMAHFSKET